MQQKMRISLFISMVSYSYCSEITFTAQLHRYKSHISFVIVSNQKAPAFHCESIVLAHKETSRNNLKIFFDVQHKTLCYVTPWLAEFLLFFLLINFHEPTVKGPTHGVKYLNHSNPLFHVQLTPSLT